LKTERSAAWLIFELFPSGSVSSEAVSAIQVKTGASGIGEVYVMATVSVRYIVDDVDAAIAFYCQHLGFHEEMHPAPTFAVLSRGDLRFLLSAPSGQGGGGQAMPDGRRPEPGGWNRISLEVSDLSGLVDALRKKGVYFRNEIVVGVGGKQILLDDPSGNPVELFEPSLAEASLSSSREHASSSDSTL
jgi:catechol 2,3-dioxygenase-like lactoylglutathione lyase family enzyme